jgi:hypothetical protein
MVRPASASAIETTGFPMLTPTLGVATVLTRTFGERLRR